MSGLATKQQSLKIFDKLKSKQANKVCSCGATHRIVLDVMLIALESADLLRLRSEEPDMDLSPIGHLPLPRLLLQPP
jgi:hypothetical protein